jgi:NAD(P)-dependent dehydrogenase (short-subunit alcohol dehydrogenase family)
LVSEGRLAGKVAIVTGAGQGIGAATARAFAAAGAQVVIAELNATTGAAVADTIVEAGGSAIFIETDVSQPVSMAAMVAQARSRYERIDVLVANAGINVFHEPLEMPDADWRRCFAVDLDGAWHSARAVLPSMRAQKGGSIVVIASTHSFSIIRNSFPYPVAKHGLIGLVRAIGVQYARDGIRVNAIAPGYIETGLLRDHFAAAADPAAARAEVCDLLPPGRIGRPDEVAMTALFLASDEAPFINAATITIDGGRSAVYHD